MGWLFSCLTGIGASSDESVDQRIHRIIYVGASLGSVPALLLYGWLFVRFGAPLAALAMFCYLAVSVLCLLLFGLSRRHFHIYLRFFLSAHLLASLALTFALGGIAPSAVHCVWGILAPLGALVVLSHREALRWFWA